MIRDPSFLSATLVPRPPRVAVLVELLDEIPWEVAYLDALQVQAEVWGGSGNILIPFRARLPELTGDLCGLLGLFDPDMLAIHRVTFGALRRLAPQTYLEMKDKHAIGSAEETSLEEWHREPVGPHLILPVSLLEYFERELACMTPGDAGVMRASVTSTSPLPWPLTHIDFISGVGYSARSFSVDTDGPWRLLIAAEVGGVSSAGRERVTQVTSWEDARVATPAEGIGLLRAVHGLTPTKEPAWSLSETGLIWGVPARPDLRPRPTVVVTGSGPGDFSLFYALRRWLKGVVWLPEELAEDDVEFRSMAHLITAIARDQQRPHVCITGASSEVRELLQNRLAVELPDSVGVGVAEPRGILPEKPSQLFVAPYIESETAFLLREGRTVPLSTPIATPARSRPAGEVRWMTQVWIDGWTPLRHGSLAGHLLSGDRPPHPVGRTTADGLAYLCPHHSIFTPSVEQATVKPRVTYMDLLEQLRLILAPQGWRIGVSDKGAYARESAALAGGWKELCTWLHDAKAMAVLGAFRAGNVGKSLSMDGRRLHLTRQDVLTSLGEDVSDTLDRLTDLGILDRGLILKCSRCRQAGWFRLGHFSSTFACWRCGLEQDVERGTWLGDPDPDWYYRTAEVVGQLLDHDGHVPFFTAEAVTKALTEPIDLAYELEVLDENGERFEVDLALSIGSRLYIGEATTNDHFGARREENVRFERLLRLAKRLSAHSIILATSQPSLRSRTMERANKALGERLLVLTALGTP